MINIRKPNIRVLLLLSATLGSAANANAQYSSKKNILGEAIKGAAIGRMLAQPFGQQSRVDAARRGRNLATLIAITQNQKSKAQERAYREQAARIQAEREAVYRQMEADAAAQRQRQILEQQRLMSQQQAQAGAQQQAALDQATLVRQIQRSLVVLGIARVPVTGVVDANTRNAILYYQKAKGLPPNGNADRRLLNHMRANGG